MIYFLLFIAFLKIGAFSFGGGYAAMPLIQAQVIDRYHWLTMTDFSDLVTIAEMTPGPIAVNSATFVGNQVAGIPGGIVATLGCILPSCIFVTILSKLYTKYRNMTLMQGILTSLRPAVIAMILNAGITIMLSCFFADSTLSFSGGNFQPRFFIYFLVALFSLRKWKMEPIKVMVCCGIAELLFQLILQKL